MHELGVHQEELRSQNEELRLAQLELSRARDRYKELFDSAPIGYLVLDGSFLIREANLKAASLLGTPLKHLIGAPLSKFMDRGEADVFYLHLIRVRKSGIQRSRELVFRRLDSSLFHGYLESSPYEDSLFGDGWRIALVDITERKLAESEARKLRDELAHVTRVSALGELASSLAHEINQPLAAILSNAQAAQRFLSQGSLDVNELTEILKDIIRDDNRAAEVIRRIRSMLKKEEICYESLSMNDVIEEILNVLSNDIALTSLTIEKILDSSLPPVRADRIQLQQVILNLVMNAEEAMKDMDPDRRRLVVRTENQDNQCVKVSIMDAGSGIQEAQIGRLFVPFYTTKAGGIGMGLAISKDIIKSHGGAIWAENNREKGTTFSFTVPFAAGVRP
ncbi:MAG TPA: ATP-binding protein [Syntrophales bacterium]|nr:ATP-binding protein [Syntrophales bacterium]